MLLKSHGLAHVNVIFFLYMSHFESPRIYLKAPEDTDQSLLMDLDSDPEVMKYLTDGRPSSSEEVKNSLSRVMKINQETQGKFGLWLAFEKETGEFIGWFLFRPSKEDPTNFSEIELGYRLKKKFWGKGYATEMSRALIENGFKKLNVKKVFAETMNNNLASQKVMQKLGMKFEKHFHADIFPGADKKAARYGISYSKDPLHGKTLESILNELVDYYGWDGLGEIVQIRCFNFDPSIKSSLTFLRKTPWARAKVESLYLTMRNSL